MKTRFLFPHRCKKIGWILLLPSALTGLILFLSDHHLPFLDLHVPAVFETRIFSMKSFLTITENNIADELFGSLTIIGALLVACSREKEEDEYIAGVRLESLLWATYINYGLLLIAILFVYGGAFFDVMVFNMFTLLIIFLARFNYMLYKNNRTAYEK